MRRSVIPVCTLIIEMWASLVQPMCIQEVALYQTEGFCVLQAVYIEHRMPYIQDPTQ